MRVLLERSDVDPNTADDKYGRVPLLCAAESGNEGVVGMFLERSDINPDIASRSSVTPLLWAVGSHKRIAKLLGEWMDSIPRHATSLQLAEPSPPSRLNSQSPLPKGPAGPDI